MTTPVVSKCASLSAFGSAMMLLLLRFRSTIILTKQSVNLDLSELGSAPIPAATSSSLTNAPGQAF